MSKPDAIQPTTRTKHVFLCVYGEPGIGKTRIVGTSAKLGKTLVIRPAVDHTDAMLPEDKPKVDEWVIKDWDDMNQCLDFLRNEGAQYGWVWVDSWSLLQDVLLDDLFETAVAEKPARARYWADKQEYGINMGRIGAWMRHAVGPDLFNLGWTGHATALASPDLDEDGDPMEKLMPWIQGKNMSPKLCGYMNIVAFLEKGGAKRNRRVLRVNSDPRFYAKDQFDAFGPEGVLWDPTMPRLMNAINATREPAASSAGAKPRKTTTTRRAVKRG